MYDGPHSLFTCFSPSGFHCRTNYMYSYYKQLYRVLRNVSGLNCNAQGHVVPKAGVI